jgi:hypothetical protein
MKKKSILSAAAILLVSSCAFGQNIFAPNPVKSKAEATKISTDLKIDGSLDEAQWQLAKPIGNFIQMDPVQGAPAKKRTVVRLLYNKNYLYAGIVCYDTVGKNNYRTLNLQRDFSAGKADFFALAIDGYNDERNAVMFGMNPYGAQRDLLSFDDNYYDPDWDGLWTVRTVRTDTAWIAEVAIPWKTLRYKNNPDSLQTWGISFGRIARSSNESSGWPAFPRAYGGLRMAYAGKLVNVQAPAPSTNIRVLPYALFSHDETKVDSKTMYSKNTFKPGGDINYAVNSNTLLDLTFNTDFAQADVDRQVNNINRFSIFYPEKRQFFLESAGLFSAGIDPLANQLSDYSARVQPFFSRAIGLDANGNPLSIDAGARLVYRSNKVNAGGLFIRQEGNGSTGPANFFVGRYSQNFGKQDRIGALVSYRSDDASGNIASSQNLTATVDGFFRFSQGLSESFMASATADFKGKPGYAASSQLFYNSNRVVAWFNESLVTDQYNPQMGFVARGNTIVTDPGFYLEQRGKWLPSFIREFDPGLAFTAYNNTATLKLTDRYINLNPVYLQFQNGGILSWNVILTKQNLENDFTPLGVTIAKGSYSYLSHKIMLGTDPSKKFSASLTGNLGQFYNGSYNSITAAFSFAPVPYLYLAPNIQYGKLANVGISKVSKDVTLYTLESRIALNPRVQLSGVVQKSSVTNSVNTNARLSWEFKPLSYLYIVFNNNDSSDQTVKTVNRQVITKISYLKQF